MSECCNKVDIRYDGVEGREVDIKHNKQLETVDTNYNGGCCQCATGKHKDREEKEIKALLNRLNRIEGQIRGIKGMLEDGAYCTDILVQSQAAASAINSFNKELLSNHIHTCVVDKIRQGDDEVIDELMTTLHKLMK